MAGDPVQEFMAQQKLLSIVRSSCLPAIGTIPHMYMCTLTSQCHNVILMSLKCLDIASPHALDISKYVEMELVERVEPASKGFHACL